MYDECTLWNKAIFVKVLKSIIFLAKSFLGNFIDIWWFFVVTLVQMDKVEKEVLWEKM